MESCNFAAMSLEEGSTSASGGIDPTVNPFGGYPSHHHKFPARDVGTACRAEGRQDEAADRAAK